MSDHGYETGRLNLPFVGISTFGKSPYVADWTAIDADVAILGAPFDFGTQWRPGARFGPRAVREASTLFSFGHAGAYDHEDDATYLGADVRMVDIGDADIIHTKTEESHANIEFGVRNILNAGALPVTIGGDHSINIPCINAFAEDCAQNGPIHVVQIDAHLDFVDTRHGVTNGHGNPMRRAIEKDYVAGMTQLGIRNVSSTAKDGYDDVRARGSDILSVRQVRKLGTQAVLERLPKGARYYVTIDIDAFCPSIAPGTGPPATAAFSITMCWRSCRAWPNAAMSWALIWSKWPPPMTPAKAPRSWRHSCCSTSSVSFSMPARTTAGQADTARQLRRRDQRPASAR